MVSKIEPGRIEINVDIFTTDEKLPDDITGKGKLIKGDEIEVSDKFAVKYPSMQPTKKSGFGEGFRFVLSVLSGVGASLIANWVWDKIKDKEVKKLIIEREVVEKEEGEVKRVIKEKIQKKFD